MLGKHNNDNKNRTSSYSFGVGRENMQKQHVDKIMKSTDGYTKVPGSGSYEYSGGFGGTNHQGFSIRKKLSLNEVLAKKSSMLPGPGQYSSLDYVGTKICESTKVSSLSQSMAKAKDRFRIGGIKIPAPNAYAPRDELNNNYSSLRKSCGSASIGRSKMNFMDTEWKNGKTIKEKAYGPGPGAYARFSDF